MTPAAQRKWRRTPLRTLLPALEMRLMTKFPPSYPVKVTYFKEPILSGDLLCDGTCNLEDDQLHIRILMQGCRACVIGALIHEWVHAYAWDYQYMEHDTVFYDLLRRIETWLWDRKGREEVLREIE